MNPTLHEYLKYELPAKGLPADDLVARFLPLLREVIEVHRRGEVAPLVDLGQVVIREGAWSFESIGSARPTTGDMLTRVESDRASSADGNARDEWCALDAWPPDPPRPVFLPGYTSWELRIGHHDALTDVFLLGQILASLACGANFERASDLSEFVEHRGNLFRWRPDLHPVIGRVVHDMTEPWRRNRHADLSTLADALAAYRAGRLDIEYELSRDSQARVGSSSRKEQVILVKLQQRLFDGTRRNRMLHFRPTAATVNLTLASAPLSVAPEDVRLESLLLCNERLLKHLDGKVFLLNKYLDFAESTYLPTALDRIRQESRRDQMEFGMAQLRLAVCFLGWTNLKVTPPERYHSPLLLAPVELTREKGVRDSFWLRTTADDLEVNPVVRRMFQQHYGLKLPESVERDMESVKSFHRLISDMLASSELSVKLEWIDRPDVAFIQEQARRRLEQYRRRQRQAAPSVASPPIDAAPTSGHAEEPLATTWANPPEVATPTDAAVVPSQDSAGLARKRDVAHGENPYQWSFDLTAVTLANFRYHRMSLVRDYDALLDECPSDSAFASVFRLSPRSIDTELQIPSLDDRYEVLPSDPTQVAAIARARTGSTYIVQGPPGTGKSQTIANLIVDYVANDKRVLFVCAKRAAIDVVFARLKQQGLDPLCCLIHDSQTDKKAFVHELKRTYEGCLASPRRKSNARRKPMLALSEAIDALRGTESALAARAVDSNLPLRALLQRAIHLRHQGVELVSNVEGPVSAAQFDEYAERLARFRDLLPRVQADGLFARHPLRYVRREFALDGRGESVIAKALDTVRHACGQTVDESQAAQLPASCLESEAHERAMLEFGLGAGELFESGDAELVLPTSDRSREMAALFGELDDIQRQLAEQIAHNQGWRFKLNPDDARRALASAVQLASDRLRWLKPRWWSLRRLLHTRYDFTAHALRPSWTEVLQQLNREYEIDSRRAAQERLVVTRFPLGDSARSVQTKVEEARRSFDALPDPMRIAVGGWMRGADLPRRAAALHRAAIQFRGLQQMIPTLLCETPRLTMIELASLLDAMRESLGDLPRILDCLRAIADVPEPLVRLLRNLPLTVPQLELHAIASSLDATMREFPLLRDWRLEVAQAGWDRLAKAHREWLDANSVHVGMRGRHRFLAQVSQAEQPSAPPESEAKTWKKAYQTGRRELEREFAKTMRYRSIRDLVTGTSGQVVRDLKPVWLMSPLSVADTLPIDPDLFDVVIFDEASQITLEEAIPTLFRARQAIVVGDEMQLPPTSFFQKRDDEDLEIQWDEDEEQQQQAQYDLASESLLNHAARHLPATMLGWHYRSRNELLIAFSNAAFYEGRLLTVPEEQLVGVARPRIVSTVPADGPKHAGALFDRAISFHRMTNGVYANRVNTAEAQYIAELLRDILRRRTQWTIAVIAFSEAQQTEIEDALDGLAESDDEFRELLDAEWEREVDGQFVGLIVKNLENIQGDERDLVILSVCYGPSPDGTMRMLFGPINVTGGERRLNVAFTRAKQHMAVVCSFDDPSITNEHNAGARCLKQYLRYAAAVSAGESAAVNRILDEMLPSPRVIADNDDGGHAAAAELAGILGERGWTCDLGVGHSHFQVDVAVRGPDDASYRLAILFDHDLPSHEPRDDDGTTADRPTDLDFLEYRLQRPKLLESFGWTVTHILLLEWFNDREAVIDRILQQLRRDEKKHA